MQGNQDMLHALMGQLGLGMPKHTLGDMAYYGPLQRQPFRADPRFMPQMGESAAPIGAPGAAMGMPQLPPMPMMDQQAGPVGDPSLGMGGQQPIDPAMMQMLGGLGLG